MFEAVLKQKEILNLIRCSIREKVVCEEYSRSFKSIYLAQGRGKNPLIFLIWKPKMP